jgi:uncharacterized protein YaaQ
MADNKRYTVTIKVVDNETGKKADLVMTGDDPTKLGISSGKFIEASTILVNLNEEELKEVAEMIKENFAEPK